ncbi:MAG: hypothetical protein IT529_20100 [Burkholderiales bacterium]|nr:hypothetical protein [Burkholderiales bacterium]
MSTIKFSRKERQRIASLLGLRARRETADAVVASIELMLSESRSRRLLAGEECDSLVPRTRGRPSTWSIDRLFDIERLAFIFEYATRRRARHSDRHAFYKLAQVCLRLEDPGKWIAQIRRPWLPTIPYMQGVSDVIKALESAGYSPPDFLP